MSTTVSEATPTITPVGANATNDSAEYESDYDYYDVRDRPDALLGRPERLLALLIGLAALTVNLASVVVVTRALRRAKRQAAHFAFILSLAASDILFALSVMLFIINKVRLVLNLSGGKDKQVGWGRGGETGLGWGGGQCGVRGEGWGSVMLFIINKVRYEEICQDGQTSVGVRRGRCQGVRGGDLRGWGWVGKAHTAQGHRGMTSYNPFSKQVDPKANFTHPSCYGAISPQRGGALLLTFLHENQTANTGVSCFIQTWFNLY